MHQIYHVTDRDSAGFTVYAVRIPIFHFVLLPATGGYSYDPPSGSELITDRPIKQSAAVRMCCDYANDHAWEEWELCDL
jgi:hypothetical protein